MNRSALASAPAPLALAEGTLVQLGRVDYQTAWRLQRQRLANRVAGRCPDTLVLLEHEPVFTAGRTACASHWGGEAEATQVAGIPLLRVERGGSVTYHGPGQLVGYPILKMRRVCDGPRAYVRLLEEVIIRTVAQWGLVGRRLEGRPGVWVGHDPPAKIAAIGARIEQGVTMHGFALNVDMDLTPFSHIVPCGLAGCRVTSMAAACGESVDIGEVRRQLAKEFAAVFGLAWTEVSE